MNTSMQGVSDSVAGSPIMGRKLGESLFEQYCSMGDYQWRPSGFD